MAQQGATKLDFAATSEIRLKNTLEVALVLDNSGSMVYTRHGSGKKRIDLLKEASKQLVDTIAGQAALMKQISKPVQFALVPFAASVNIGSGQGDRHLDGPGRHLADPSREFRLDDVHGVDQESRAGRGWRTTTRRAPAGAQRRTRRLPASRSTAEISCGPPTPAAPRRQHLCELGGLRRGEAIALQHQRRDAGHSDAGDAVRADVRAGRTRRDWTAAVQADNGYEHQQQLADTTTRAQFNSRLDPASILAEIFRRRRRYGATTGSTGDEGPNASCTTKPITALTDVSTTPVRPPSRLRSTRCRPTAPPTCPKGMAWGWRVLSSGAPFTEGRPDTEKGNDKVVIVLTDGQNTYYTPSSLGPRTTLPATSRPIRPTAMPENGTLRSIRRRAFSRARRLGQQDRLLERQLHQGDERAVRDALRQRQGRQRARHDGVARPRFSEHHGEGADGCAEGLLVGLALPQGRQPPA